MLKKLLFLMTLAALLAACLPSAQPAADVQGQVNTAVAGTMQANERIERAVAQTVAAQDTDASPEAPAGVDSNVLLQITDTPTPTFTPFILPTFTPTATLVQPKYSCSVITRKPTTNQVMHGGADFDIKWTITNTGTATWYDAADIKYYSGTSFALAKRHEIRTPLAPGESFDIVLDAKAPKTPGPQFMAWYVEGGLCFAYVSIWVK